MLGTTEEYTASQQTPPSKKKAADRPASFNRPRKQGCALHKSHHTGCDIAHTHVWVLLPTGTVCEALKPTQAPARHLPGLVFFCLLVTHSIYEYRTRAKTWQQLCLSQPNQNPKVCDGRHQHPLGKMIVANQCTLGSTQHQQPPCNQQFSHSRHTRRDTAVSLTLPNNNNHWQRRTLHMHAKNSVKATCWHNNSRRTG